MNAVENKRGDEENGIEYSPRDQEGVVNARSSLSILWKTSAYGRINEYVSAVNGSRSSDKMSHSAPRRKESTTITLED